MANKILLSLFLLLSVWAQPKTIFAQDNATGEFGSTPLSLIDQYPKPKNHIAIMSFLGLPPSDIPKYKDYIGKEIDYFWFGFLATALTDKPLYDAYLQGARDFKNANPNMKVGIYGAGVNWIAPYNNGYQFAADSDQLHDPSGNLIHFSAETRVTFLDVSNPVTNWKMANSWNNLLTQNPNISGLFIDSFQTYHYDPSLAGGCLEGPCNTREWWVNSSLNALNILKTAIPSNVDLIYNGLLTEADSYNCYIGPLDLDGLSYANGVINENAHRAYVSSEKFPIQINAMKQIVDSGKKLFFNVVPQVIPLQYPTFSFTNDLNLERFFLATYLLIQKNPYTYFGYHPGGVYNSTEGVFFYADWNKNYGAPVSDFVALGNGLYIRNYQQGIAVVNPTDSSQTYYFPNNDWKYHLWDPQASPATSSISVEIPKKTGTFYFISTSTPTALPGDLNSDGHVNLFDYNLLVAGFGTTYTIFDYNSLVANYGK